MARTRREDWIERGFAVLREGGEATLTIDRLCTELGRTKGAFYHHFADVHEYTEALLAAWEELNTSGPIVRAEAAGAEVRGKRRALDAAVRASDTPLDLAVRAWGLRDPRARAFVARVDERRVAYLTELYPPSVPIGTRRKIARLEYAAFVGAQQLFPDLSAPAVREMERMLTQALRSLLPDSTRP